MLLCINLCEERFTFFWSCLLPHPILHDGDALDGVRCPLLLPVCSAYRRMTRCIQSADANDCFSPIETCLIQKIHVLGETLLVLLDP